MNTRSKQTRVKKILALHNAARQAYAQADKLLWETLPYIEVGEVIRVKEGEFQLVDNFAESNTAFRVARIRRFELKELTKKQKKELSEKKDT